jgi:hypothetical protein
LDPFDPDQYGLGGFDDPGDFIFPAPGWEQSGGTNAEGHEEEEEQEEEASTPALGLEDAIKQAFAPMTEKINNIGSSQDPQNSTQPTYPPGFSPADLGIPDYAQQLSNSEDASMDQRRADFTNMMTEAGWSPEDAEKKWAQSEADLERARTIGEGFSLGMALYGIGALAKGVFQWAMSASAEAAGEGGAVSLWQRVVNALRGGAAAEAEGQAGAGETGALNLAENLPKVYVNDKGLLTNGLYTLDEAGMAPHLTGSLEAGKSQFLSGVDAEKAVLDAAAYADKAGLWVNNTAKVFVENGPVGVIGKSGELTNWINVYRTNTGFVHGTPGGAL